MIVRTTNIKSMKVPECRISRTSGIGRATAGLCCVVGGEWVGPVGFSDGCWLIGVPSDATCQGRGNHQAPDIVKGGFGLRQPRPSRRGVEGGASVPDAPCMPDLPAAAGGANLAAWAAGRTTAGGNSPLV